MNTRTIGLPSDEDLRASTDALRRAALRAREVARQTGTGLAIHHDGKIVIMSPDDLERLDAATATPASR